MGVENPWVRLPNQAPYVLLEDREPISEFNAGASPHRVVRLDLRPEPFVGRPEAPILLLSRFPFPGPEDADQWQDPDFIGAWRNNIEHAPQQHPFYPLAPRFERRQFGSTKYWFRNLQAVLAGYRRYTITNNIFCVELFPYHTETQKGLEPRIPSQEYGAELVRAAIRRGAAIVIMVGATDWKRLVPELRGHADLYMVLNPRTAAITERNCRFGLARIRAILDSLTDDDPSAAPAEIRDVLNVVNLNAGRQSQSQGPQMSPEVRKIIENHAMDRAREHFQSLGWNCTDVSSDECYDFRCVHPDHGELRVEVKGTTSEGREVLLTPNEVEHARRFFPRTALFVLAGIEISTDHNGNPCATGGTARVLNPWDIGQGRLTTLAYSYRPVEPSSHR